VANYPASVYAPAAKAAGNTIQASWFNDPDGEIAAVEDALINGPITLANVTVTGTVTGANARPPSCRVMHSTLQNVASDAFTGLDWDTEVIDASGMHSTGAGSSKMTFAGSSGMYVIGANVSWSANSSGVRIIRLVLNDSSGIAANLCAQGGAAELPQTVSCVFPITSSADYVTVQVYQNSGSTMSVANSTYYGMAFWAQRLSL
jgi:hypothetical protein